MGREWGWEKFTGMDGNEFMVLGKDGDNLCRSLILNHLFCS